ncbi:hypothetical protein GCM10009760_18150 [Kitasatospora kazusensis]|uniref:Uncharacterized protein n=1 Tax=Kitasatospora kazusensis TaxID=407974 RepID=A0ABP5KUD9_9ACTN
MPDRPAYDSTAAGLPGEPTPIGRLDAFWDGDFTLGPTPAGQGPAPVPVPTSCSAIDDLGSSGIRIGGRDLAALLAPVYRRLTGDSTGPTGPSPEPGGAR